MLDLCLDTIITGYKFGSMLSKLNVLTAQKKLQNVMTNNVIWTQKLKYNKNKTKKQTLKSLPETGIELGTTCTAVC